MTAGVNPGAYVMPRTAGPAPGDIAGSAWSAGEDLVVVIAAGQRWSYEEAGGGMVVQCVELMAYSHLH